MECHEAEFSKKGGPFHMAQWWVNRPKKHKMDTPRYQAIKATDRLEVKLPDGKGTVRALAAPVLRITDRVQLSCSMSR